MRFWMRCTIIRVEASTAWDGQMLRLALRPVGEVRGANEH